MCLQNNNNNNKMDTKAEQLGFEVFTQMKLGDGRMEFRADLTRAYGASCVLHTALFAD